MHGPQTGPETERAVPGASPPARLAWGRLRHALQRTWPYLRYVVGLAIAAWVFDTLNGHRGELDGALGILGHLRWDWVVLAAGAETVSLVAFSVLQIRLLAAGSVEVGFGPMNAVTLAANAIGNSIPLGPAASTVYTFRQYRRRGADDALAGWSLAATFVLTTVTLAGLAAAGLALAGPIGEGFDLVWVTLAVFAVAVALTVVFFHEQLMARLVAGGFRLSRRLTGHPRGDVGRRIDMITTRLTAVHLGWRRAGGAGGWALANWVFDCGCLVCAFVAVGAPVPWRALLLAYGAGQLAANLPITPGGLGVVEGSLIIGLVAFGGSETSTVAAVLLYRIFEFWLPLPIGWAAWGGLAWTRRQARGVGRHRGPGAGRGKGPVSGSVSGSVPGATPPSRAGAGSGMMVVRSGRLVVRSGRLVVRLGRSSRRPTVRRIGAMLLVCAVVPLLAACTAEHASLGTGSSPCFLALPAAADAVGHRGHLDGVRLVPASSIHAHTRLRALLDRRAGGPVGDVCLVAYTGDFTAATVERPAGSAAGHDAMVVLTTPHTRLLATVVLERLPVRFRHPVVGS